MSLLKYKVDSLNIKLDFKLNTHIEQYIQIQTQTNTDIFIKKFNPLKITKEYNDIFDTIIFLFQVLKHWEKNILPIILDIEKELLFGINYMTHNQILYLNINHIYKINVLCFYVNICFI